MKRLNQDFLSMLLCILLSTPAVFSAPINVEPEHEKRYQGLLNELRCLVCQNQTIAESNSELANDLRVEIGSMLNQGASDAEIIAFMGDRYGDFILYKPLVQPKTYLLWFGPFLFLIVALLFVLMFIKKHNSTANLELTEDENKKLSSILKEPTE